MTPLERIENWEADIERIKKQRPFTVRAQKEIENFKWLIAREKTGQAEYKSLR